MILEQVTQFAELLFTWPILPASIVVLMTMFYGGLVLLGVVDLDLFDFDLDVESDAARSVGFVSLKFLNLGEVPLMVWVSTFGFLWWVVSILFGMITDAPLGEASGDGTVWRFARNLVIGVLLTKAVTEPLKQIFEKQATRTPEDLIGQACEISTYEVTPDAGQARFPTEAAPLLLNVRTAGESLKHGDEARIIDYDPATRLYLVTALTPDE